MLVLVAVERNRPSDRRSGQYLQTKPRHATVTPTTEEGFADIATFHGRSAAYQLRDVLLNSTTRRGGKGSAPLHWTWRSSDYSGSGRAAMNRQTELWKIRATRTQRSSANRDDALEYQHQSIKNGTGELRGMATLTTGVTGGFLPAPPILVMKHGRCCAFFPAAKRPRLPRQSCFTWTSLRVSIPESSQGRVELLTTAGPVLSGSSTSRNKYSKAREKEMQLLLQRVVLLVIGLAASLWQPSAFVNAADTPGITTNVNARAGCNSTDAYPAPGNVMMYNFTSLGDFATLHFSYFNLPPKDFVVVRLSSPELVSSNQTTSFTYKGSEFNGDFFADTLRTPGKLNVMIELHAYAKGSADPSMSNLCKGFAVDRYDYVGITASKSSSEEVCGADNTQEAMCFISEPKKIEASKAVIRLLIHKDTGSYFCTGWLVGCEGHVITNHHCISTQAHASSTEFEFMARGKTCGTNCESPLGCPGSVRARSSTLITANPDLDYALVKLDINLSTEYGYLTMRETGATMADTIYIPQHPSGWGMRIAAKDDSGAMGTVTSLTMGGCAVDQVAYNLDTRAGSSGSPVIATSDNAVVALHHCGGCPNTAINSYKIVANMRALNILPKCAVYQAQTPAPGPAPTTPAPTPAPTPAYNTQAPAPGSVLTLQTKVDGTIIATGTTTSVDYIDLTLIENANVELDILSMEEIANGNTATYADVNGDCNAAYIDSKIILFRLNNAGTITQQDVIATNLNAPNGYGMKDGSLSSLDSYLYLPLTKGKYRLAVGTSAMSKVDAVSKTNGAARLPRVCASKVSNYGNYRLTVSATASVQVTSPGTYIGSQCSVSGNAVFPYSACPYHKEAALSTATTVAGSIMRQSSSVSVDHIPFAVTNFGRVSFEVSSYGTKDGVTYLDVNGFCKSAYIDPVAYLFRAASNGQQLTSADLINAGDDDENFALRKGRHSISFRDPFFSLALPTGSYVLVVGRYPLSIDEAIAKAGKTSVNKFTPESCGAISQQGSYLVTFGSPAPLVAMTAPSTYVGTRCTPSDPTSNKSIC